MALDDTTGRAALVRRACVDLEIERMGAPFRHDARVTF